MMEKLRKHGYKNWLEAMDRDCSPGHAPHNPRVIYNQETGFRVRSALSPLGDGDAVAMPEYEPYGTSKTEYQNAVEFLKSQTIFRD